MCDPVKVEGVLTLALTLTPTTYMDVSLTAQVTEIEFLLACSAVQKLADDIKGEARSEWVDIDCSF